MGNAAAYARVSTDEQARQGYSLEDQQHQARERATTDHLDLADTHVYVDAMSGKRRDRPAYERMLAAAADAAFETLYVWKLDRLGRDAEELLRARRMLEAAGVRIVSLTEGEQESTLIYGFRALVAQEEREKISERTRAGLAAVARAGRWTGGQPPLGYRLAGKGVWQIHPGEAAILHRIDEMYLAGIGVNRIARALNADEIPTRTGRKWCNRKVMEILDHPTYLGVHRFNGTLYQGTHPPLRTEETWARLQALRTARKKGAPGGRGAQPKRHLLTRGMLRCRCGAAMTARTFPGTGDYYYCSARHTRGVAVCAMPGLKRDTVDGPLLELFETLVLDTDATVATIRTEAERLIAAARARADAAGLAAATLDDQLARVRADYLAGDLTASEWRQLRGELADERAAAIAEQTRHMERARELDVDADRLDAEEAFARRLVDLRRLVTGRVDTTADLDALRAALAAAFERFDLAELDDGWVAVPRIRGDRRLEVARTPAEWLLPVRRVALSGSEPYAPAPHSQETPLVDALFAPVQVGSARS